MFLDSEAQTGASGPKKRPFWAKIGYMQKSIFLKNIISNMAQIAPKWPSRTIIDDDISFFFIPPSKIFQGLKIEICGPAQQPTGRNWPAGQKTPWKGPSGPETLLTCIIHHYMSHWVSLGSFRHHWATRGKKVQSRREREIWKNILQFREEKEKGISFLKVREEKEKFFKWFSTFEKRKRKGFHFLEIREEKEKFKIQILHLTDPSGSFSKYSQSKLLLDFSMPSFLYFESTSLQRF